MTHYELKKSLSALKKNTPVESIQSMVIDEALERDNVLHFFSDITRYGCESGMISSLVYYTDTHEFYDAHYDEIESLRIDWEGMLGNPMIIDGDLKNFFAWFSFQHVAFRIARELELDF